MTAYPLLKTFTNRLTLELFGLFGLQGRTMGVWVKTGSIIETALISRCCAGGNAGV